MGQGLGDNRRRGSDAFVHAEQQLQAQSDACVPTEGKDTDVTRHDGWPQEVLHRRGAVRVPVKHLRREEHDADGSAFHRKALTVEVKFI